MVLQRVFGAALLLLTRSTVAQTLLFTMSSYNIVPGVPYNITWTGDGTPVNLTLLNGPTTNLIMAGKGYIALNVTSSPYKWTPSLVIADGTYALEIMQDGNTNYSPRFNVTGMIAHIPPKSPPATLSPTRFSSLPSSESVPAGQTPVASSVQTSAYGGQATSVIGGGVLGTGVPTGWVIGDSTAASSEASSRGVVGGSAGGMIGGSSGGGLSGGLVPTGSGVPPYPFLIATGGTGGFADRSTCGCANATAVGTAILGLSSQPVLFEGRAGRMTVVVHLVGLVTGGVCLLGFL